MVTRVPIDSYMARWARERCRLTLEEAAKLLECEPADLEKIEKEQGQPSASMFRKMASIYVLPEATLLGLVPANERPMPKDFRSFDGQRVELKYETIVAVRRVQARQEALERLSEVDEQILAPELPIYSMRVDPEALGATYRREFGFKIVDQQRMTTEKAFMRWRMMVEDLGVSVYVEPLGEDDTRGVSIFFNQFPAIIIDQTEKHPGARLFTLFHELAHLFIRHTGISNFNNSNAVERFCNRFAAAFLMPREAVEAVLELPEDRTFIAPSMQQIEVAARKLCVTISQLALRLEHLRIAKEGYYTSIVSRLNRGGSMMKPSGGEWRFAYVSRYGHHLPSSVISSLERGQITSVQAARILEAAPVHLPTVKRTLKERRDSFSNVG